MINTKVYGQRDVRWGNYNVGFSRYKIKTHGCTITALSSFLTAMGHPETPLTVNDKLKKRNGFAKDLNGQRSLVIWYKVAEEWEKVKWIKRVPNFNNVEVSWYVYWKNIPVMVEVNASSIGAPRHWCCYLGDRKMMDPWVGQIVPTSKYPATGYALYDK